MTRFLAGFASVAAGNYGALVLSFAINVVLTRALGVAEFGRLALLLMVSQVLAFAVSNWTLTALVHFGAREFAASQAVGRAFWTRAAVTLPALALALGGFVAGSDRLAGWLGVPGWALLVVVLHFLLTAGLHTAGAVLQAVQRMSRYGLALLADKALALGAILVLLQAGRLDALTALACYAASGLAVAAWVFHDVGRVMLRPLAVTREAWAAMWRFSVPLIASAWAGLFGTQWLDYVVIKHYLPLGELGLYSLAWQVAGVVQQVTVIASTLMLPPLSVMVAQGREDEVRRIVDRAVPYWLLALSTFLGVVLVAVSVLVPLVFGPAFAGAVPALALLVVATIALAMFNTLTPLLTAHGATWTISGICLLSAAVNVGVNLLLIPRFGIGGAAAATLVAYAVSAALALAVVHTRLRAAVGRYALFALPVSAVYVCWLALDGPAFYPAAAAALAATALALVRAFRLFEPADLVLIGQADLPPWVRSGLVKVFSLRGGVA